MKRAYVPWKSSDEKYLIAYYYADGPLKVAIALDRTLRTVLARAHKLRGDGRLTKQSRSGISPSTERSAT